MQKSDRSMRNFGTDRCLSTFWLLMFVLLPLLLARCAAEPFVVTEQPVGQTSIATQSRIEVSTPLETSQTAQTPPGMPTTPSPRAPVVLTQTPGQSVPPTLLYTVENQVLELTPGEEPHPIVELPDAGPAKQALQVGNILILLREQGIQRVNLVDSSSELTLRFDSPVLFGDFVLAGDNKQILYSAVVTDLSAEFGFRTLIGTYQANSGQAKPVLSLPQNLRVLGMTTDGRGLYLLPIGQDPEFGGVLLVDLETNQVVKELPASGVLHASLAPNGRLLATMVQGCPSCDHLDTVLNLYDLPSLPLTPPRTLALPQSPSYIAGLAWSPDSSGLYFQLNPGNSWDEVVNSYGIWQVDISSGDISQVAAIDQTLMHLVTISPDGQWLLLEHESQQESLFVDLSSGKIQAFTSPAAALVSKWR